MAIYQLYSHCMTCKYKNAVFSKAFLFVIICLLLAYVPPFIILCGSDGFWIRTETRREKPNIHFKHDFLLVLETSEFGLPTVCSTFSDSQFSLIERNVCSATKVIEEDIDKDGKNDNLIMELEVPLRSTDIVYHIKLFLLFDYRLSHTSEFHMESMGYIEKSSSWVGGARLDIYGDLRLLLKEPIIPYGIDNRYNKSIFHSNREVVDIPTILESYSERNASTHIFPINALWTFGRAPIDPFILTIKIHYPEEQVIFYTSVFRSVQWAWIQYLAMLWPFLYASRTLCSLVFKHRIVNAAISLDPPVYSSVHKKNY